MDCYRPLRIKNQYNDKYMHVDCRNCPACLVRSANLKSAQLSVTLSQYKYKYFVTLTYDNDSVPYIIPTMMAVFRGQDIDNFPDVIGYMDEPVPVDLDWLYLTNHSVVGAVGVLWYYDVQCFFKRLRKYINKHYGKREWKYTAVGEYGSHYGRPHYHIVIYSNELLYDECQTACFKCWSYHNWDRFFEDGENKAFKRCDEGCSAYISSYINCSNNCVKISNYKQFRQKTWRSKNTYFGLDAEVLEIYKKDVIRLSNGVVQDGDRQIFYILQDKKLDSVGFRLLSSRYIYTCFHKFKGWSELSFKSRVSRAYYIISQCEIAVNLKLPLSRLALKLDDLSFYRAFCRFKLIFGSFSISDYMALMFKVLDYYKSCLLREQMLSYGVLGKDNYFMSLVDTCVEDPSKLRMKLLPYVSSGLPLHRLNVSCPPLIKNKLDNYVDRYKKRLMTKHLNDVNKIMFSYI